MLALQVQHTRKLMSKNGFCTCKRSLCKCGGAEKNENFEHLASNSHAKKPKSGLRRMEDNAEWRMANNANPTKYFQMQRDAMQLAKAGTGEEAVALMQQAFRYARLHVDQNYECKRLRKMADRANAPKPKPRYWDAYVDDRGGYRLSMFDYNKFLREV